MIEVRTAVGRDRTAALARLAEAWGEPILAKGRRYDLRDCEILIAGDGAGLAAIDVSAPPVCELVAINAFTPRRGVGSALIEHLSQRLSAEGFSALALTTTNDNLDALRFYQRRGFRLAVLRPGAVDAARLIKPGIPRVGDSGVPIRDEIDLIRDL